MKNINRSLFTWVFLGLSVVIWIGSAWVASIKPDDTVGLIAQLPKVAAIDGMFVWLFVKWGWRCRFLHPWLVPYPDLNGTWEGQLISTYGDPLTTDERPPITATLTIRQTFMEVSCAMRTRDMNSTSGLAGFLLNPDQQQKQLVYTYLSHPRATLLATSPIHHGAVILDILNEPPTRLRGRYWTSRATAGEADFTYTQREIREDPAGDKQ